MTAATRAGPTQLKHNSQMWSCPRVGQMKSSAREIVAAPFQTELLDVSRV